MLAHSGCNFVEYSGVGSPVISGVDFTTGGGANLLLAGGTTNATVTNCKFGATLTANAYIDVSPDCPGLTVTKCHSGGGLTGIAAIYPRGGGTTVVEHCHVVTVPMIEDPAKFRQRDDNCFTDVSVELDRRLVASTLGRIALGRSVRMRCRLIPPTPQWRSHQTWGLRQGAMVAPALPQR